MKTLVGSYGSLIIFIHFTIIFNFPYLSSLQLLTSLPHYAPSLFHCVTRCFLYTVYIFSNIPPHYHSLLFFYQTNTCYLIPYEVPMTSTTISEFLISYYCLVRRLIWVFYKLYPYPLFTYFLVLYFLIPTCPRCSSRQLFPPYFISITLPHFIILSLSISYTPTSLLILLTQLSYNHLFFTLSTFHVDSVFP